MAYLWGRHWTRAEVLEHVGRIDQLAGFHAASVLDGPARGSRTLDVETGGGLAFRILPDRGADIGACRFDGRSVAWISPVGEAHPAYYQPSGEGWLRNFGGGLMTTCGLDQFGPATRDNGEEFGLHGRIDNTPAENISYKAAWRGDEYELVVEASVRQARVFGENLVLNRTIRTALGSTRIDITDHVTNAGFVRQPHMLLYHCNFGFPFLNEQAKLSLDSEGAEPRDEVAEAGLSAWDKVEPPQRGFAEQVFLHRLRSDASGISSVIVSNEQAGLAMKLSIQTATLPYLYQWKMMGLGTYVMGLEPANCPGIGGRSTARELGVLPSLAPQETRTYSLSFEFFRPEDTNEGGRGG